MITKTELKAMTTPYCVCEDCEKLRDMASEILDLRAFVGVALSYLTGENSRDSFVNAAQILREIYDEAEQAGL